MNQDTVAIMMSRKEEKALDRLVRIAFGDHGHASLHLSHHLMSAMTILDCLTSVATSIT